MNNDEYDALMKKGARQQAGERAGWTVKDASSLWSLLQDAQSQLQARSESGQTKKRLLQGLKAICQHHPDVANCPNCNTKYYLGLK